MITQAQLTALVHRYAALSGNPPRRVSSWIWRAAVIIDRLDQGGAVELDRAVHALQWLSDHWPAHEPWPAGIERPPSHPPDVWPPKKGPKKGRPRKAVPDSGKS